MQTYLSTVMHTYMLKIIYIYICSGKHKHRYIYIHIIYIHSFIHSFWRLWRLIYRLL